MHKQKRVIYLDHSIRNSIYAFFYFISMKVHNFIITQSVWRAKNLHRNRAISYRATVTYYKIEGSVICASLHSRLCSSKTVYRRL